MCGNLALGFEFVPIHLRYKKPACLIKVATWREFISKVSSTHVSVGLNEPV